ncbi:helix-turn-helix transcriptional regulator [Desnuesiella massiliensis]|uniref:helix-turn-helix transcriptional regulator n=1 Tax=Desnuesiella massiliensis TaxID=1650662 RepID=UPI0006E3164B|nr:YafY family protein [Desnuesiella massiliensis]
MRLHRLIGIIMLLNSKEAVKARELAKILESSERTIYRDIDILCEAGIPIVSIPGPAGGFSFMEGYKFHTDFLYKKDIVNILLSTMGINVDKNTEAAQELKNTIIKLENSVPEKYREDIVKAKERFFFDAEPWWGKKLENKNIDIVKNAILDLKKMKINYRKYDGTETERIIRPYGVIVKNSQWYLVAFCEEKNQERIFKCSRIVNPEILLENFVIPREFSLEEFWGNSKQQFIEKAASEDVVCEKYPVKVKLFKEKKGFLEGFKILECLNHGAYWIYKIDMLSFETACSMLFPLSDEVQIIEPIEVKNFIIGKAKNILSFNNF